MEEKVILEENVEMPALETDISNITKIKLDEYQIIGTDEQVSKMMTSYSEYMGEIENPYNDKDNPFFHSKYAPLSTILNTVRPVLAKYGLMFMQSVYTKDNRIYVHNVLAHKDGGMITPPEFGVADVGDIQKKGSLITYMRRYTCAPLLGVAGEEDDDGNSLVKAPTATKTFQNKVDDSPSEKEKVVAFINSMKNKKRAKTVMTALKIVSIPKMTEEQSIVLYEHIKDVDVMSEDDFGKYVDSLNE